jgi:4a-hydroxytetrahydrobiopterin dehydratase
MEISNLVDRSCKPCEGDEPPLEGKALEELSEQLGEGWKVMDEDHLEKEYEFKDFREALVFTNAVGDPR